MHLTKRLIILLIGLIATAAIAQPVLASHLQRTAAIPTVRLAKTGLGSVLVNSKGFTLYHLIKENTGANVCDASSQCRATWPPLLLPKGVTTPTKGAGVTDKVGLISRPGIGRQVTYDGWPLYTFAGDSKPGQTSGQGFEKVWFVLQTAPMVPFKIHITSSGSTVWGTVKLSYSYRGKTFKSSCNKSACTVFVHAGATVHLAETATSSASWPFSGWSLKAIDTAFKKSSTSTSTSQVSNDGYNVTATYVVSGYPRR